MKRWIAIGLRMLADHIDPQPPSIITPEPLDVIKRDFIDANKTPSEWITDDA